jgi:hypothetical protein
VSPRASPAPEVQPRPWLLAALALLPVLGAYSNVLDVGFMWDDHVLIEQNADLHALHPPWAYLGRSFWQHPFMYGTGHAFYRPLVTFTLAFDWALGGGSPVAFHLTNLALHLATVGLVFALARRRGGSPVAAAASAALFGVMPRLTESVTWVVGRTDVLATLLVLVAAWVALALPPRARWLAGVALFLGLLAKEVAVLGVLLLAAEAAGRVLRRELAARAALATALPALAAVVAWWALRASSSGSSPIALHDPATFLAGLGHYAWMVLTPWNPVAQIGFILEPEPWAVALGGSLTLGVAAGSWRLSRGAQAWRALWVLAAFGGVVMVSLVVLTVYTIASDRFLYLPLALLAVVAASAPWPRWLVGGAALATLALAAVTWSHNGLWAEPLRFWAEVYRTASPRNPGAPEGLADALAEVHRFNEARELYVRALDAQGRPGDPRTRLSLAVMNSRLGADDAALLALTDLLATRPDWKRARYDAALFLARAQDFAGARAALADVRLRFGDDDVLRGFERDLASAEHAASSGTARERAEALHALGATAKAQAAWRALLADRSARLDAARWLVLFGDEAAAHEGLAALGGDAAAQAVVHERFGFGPLQPRAAQ